MNRFVLLGLLASTFLAASCGSGGGKTFADARWQIRCPPGFPMCSRNGAEVDVFAFDGDDETNTRVSCDITESGDSLIVSFTVSLGREPLLSVNGVVTGLDGGTVRGDACRISVLDDGNSFGGPVEGRCGANPTSEAQPCQIGPIVFDDEPETGDPRMSTTIFCSHLKAPSNPTLLQRDLTFPNMPVTPATVAILNCNGI